MLPRQANDPMERIDPADPIDPIDSTDPTEPIDRTEPTESIDSTDPRDRIDSTEPLTDHPSIRFASPETIGNGQKETGAQWAPVPKFW